MKNIARGDDTEQIRRASLEPASVPEYHDYSAEDSQEQKHLLRAAKIARWVTIAMTLCFLVLWPLPLYGSGYIFSKSFFTGWVVVGIIWLFGSTICVGIYPLWESRSTIVHVAKSMLADISGKSVVQGQPDSDSGSESHSSGVEKKASATKITAQEGLRHDV